MSGRPRKARAANAGIGVVVGGFLPRIGLSALLGAVSPSLDFITSRKAGLWSVGAGATGPLFQGGGLRGQYEEAKAAWEEAKLSYQQAPLNAFADVANALVSRQRLTEKREQQERAVEAYLEAVKLSTQRYSLGKASYFEVLQAQQPLFPAEAALAQTRRDELVWWSSSTGRWAADGAAAGRSPARQSGGRRPSGARRFAGSTRAPGTALMAPVNPDNPPTRGKGAR